MLPLATEVTLLPDEVTARDEVVAALVCADATDDTPHRIALSAQSSARNFGAGVVRSIKLKRTSKPPETIFE